MLSWYKNKKMDQLSTILMRKERKGKQNNVRLQRCNVSKYNLASLYYFSELRKAAARYGLFQHTPQPTRQYMKQ